MESDSVAEAAAGSAHVAAAAVLGDLATSGDAASVPAPDGIGAAAPPLEGADAAGDATAVPAPKRHGRPPPTLAERLEKIETQGLDSSKRELDLSDRHMGDEGMQQVMHGLAKNNGLRRLMLQRVGLTPAGLVTVGQLLEKGGRAARRRATALRKKSEGYTLSEEDFAGGYADPLQHLQLSGNDAGPTGLGTEFCEGLATSVSLRTLELSCCSLCDVGVVRLLEVIGRLNTGETEVCLLEHLDLSNNCLTAASAHALAPVLGRNMNLRSIDVKANLLGTEGALGIAECIRANKGRIQKFFVSQNAMKFEGVHTLVERFRMPVQFIIKLNRPRGAQVGMSFNANLAVMGAPTGLTDRWGAENPSEAVCAGDKVIRVNDKTSKLEMEEELQEKQILEIELLRPGAGLAYLDLCHNEVDLEGVHRIKEECEKDPDEGSRLRGGLLKLKDGRQLNINAF